MRVKTNDVVQRTERLPRVHRAITSVILIVAAFSVLGSLTTFITTLTGRVLIATGGTDGRLPLSALPQLQQADLREGATGTLADTDLSLRLLGALPSLLHAVTIVIAAVLLVRVLEEIARARPFSAAVLADWRRLTLALLVGGIAQTIAETAAWLYLSTHMGLMFGAGRTSDAEREAFFGGDYQAMGSGIPQWPLPILIAGGIALALSAAFRTGAKHERDADGVV